MKSTKIKDFYAGSTVLVTGGTGFLGKALIEKLVRSCNDIKCIYVLMRTKQGASSEERLEQFKNNEIFDRVRVENPEALRKIFSLNGDINVDNLGLSPADEELVQSSVNVVFHSAANVAMIRPIKTALNTNTLGTRRLLDLCRRIKPLKKFVYISTAFSNPGEEFVEEKVYESLQKLDLDWYVKCADVLQSETATKIMHELQGLFPNTYTMTKFMAEQVVEDYRNRFGLCTMIVRPSVIGPAYEEPFAGWLENVIGFHGFVFATVRGSLSSFPFKPRAVIDIVPLDMVCSNIIVAAWFDTWKPSIEIRVINCTSGGLNGINHLDLFKLVVKYAREYPSEHTMLYPNVYMPDNRFVHGALATLQTFVPAYVSDLRSRLQGKPAMEVKVQNTISLTSTLSSFVTQKTYKYSNKSVIEMLQYVQLCDDFSEFNFDCCSIDWDEYVKRWVIGLRKYILKCDESSLPAARRALTGLHALWLLYYGSVNTLTGYAFYKLFSKL